MAAGYIFSTPPSVKLIVNPPGERWGELFPNLRKKSQEGVIVPKYDNIYHFLTIIYYLLIHLISVLL